MNPEELAKIMGPASDGAYQHFLAEMGWKAAQQKQTAKAEAIAQKMHELEIAKTPSIADMLELQLKLKNDIAKQILAELEQATAPPLIVASQVEVQPDEPFFPEELKKFQSKAFQNAFTKIDPLVQLNPLTLTPTVVQGKGGVPDWVIEAASDLAPEMGDDALDAITQAFVQTAESYGTDGAHKAVPVKPAPKKKKSATDAQKALGALKDQLETLAPIGEGWTAGVCEGKLVFAHKGLIRFSVRLESGEIADHEDDAPVSAMAEKFWKLVVGHKTCDILKSMLREMDNLAKENRRLEMELGVRRVLAEDASEKARRSRFANLRWDP